MQFARLKLVCRKKKILIKTRKRTFTESHLKCSEGGKKNVYIYIYIYLVLFDVFHLDQIDHWLMKISLTKLFNLVQYVYIYIWEVCVSIFP